MSQSDAPTGLPFLFGMNEFTTQPWRFEEDVARYPALGVEAIEVCEAKLDPARLDAQMKSVIDSGMRISAVQPKIRTFFGSRMAPEPHETEARVAALRDSIGRLAPYAPGTVFVVNTGASPEGDMRRVMDETIRHLRALCPFAAEQGVSIALEPLNPTSLNIESAIWTVGQAMDIVDGVGHSAMGLCLDLWNVWQNADLEAQIRRAGQKITVLQVSDWRTPHSFTDRLVPGQGDIPLGRLLRTTYAAGFRGACTVEIFSSNVPDSLYDGDLARLIQDSRVGLQAAWTNR
ncbi:4-hydroxyphenylpyruvate dioxygenase [Neoasaia chiangmaiensis NBRC 101099]|uniref:4-hydroxyphenylpyruvate dioxygenase n=1 Tax=Neoasaia chiangmaiensis TaxID=320497 RepID=A0A1U9KPQ8_9PROT|nr:sugar phosphate isomerase/epimerase family protein [Neoasaia chiangmaiensis]AQS87690.1 4-hydroxyphenylpyruvate dioxygenase [Neoasaia chiangmaiensis]GBR41846.1 4-hydroxyphenylpyruvate dioxygenase [Neoasaia chiangmaiensis NBRC 101099]GEN14276.1 hypothetical protein NCH01_07070 [Neoasaia chiangmaiensis]